ncbi:hypothetical protein ABZT03_22490 [Streptomyces sp. NPDC005574]|uniref:hypothetical protein n=1 Tax=Streptomyces sp. NPDC005574 TaxID=3156891 RepID=UPI00339F557F
MAVDQLPGQVREFANYLNGLLARVDQRDGWSAVFWQRDPDGMRACLDGHEIPPWDVVEALLQDLAAGYGPTLATAETGRARTLHSAAVAAHDDRPGGRDALGDRFDVMLREQRYAAERQADLNRSLASATTQEEADAIRLDLAWARDDHERATRRCSELRSRAAELDRRRVEGQARSDPRGPGGAPWGGSGRAGSDAGFAGLPQQRDVPRATGAREGGPTGPERTGDHQPTPSAHTADEYAPAHGTGEYTPGRTADEYTPAHGTGEYTPGRTADEYTPAHGTGEYAPARTADEYTPARATDEYTQARTAGDFSQAHTAGGSPATRAAGDHRTPHAADADQAPWATGTDHTPSHGEAGPAGHAGRTDRTDLTDQTDHTDLAQTTTPPSAEPGPHTPTAHRPALGTVPTRTPTPTPDTVPKQRKRRRGSARFAGMADAGEEAAPAVVPPESAAAPVSRPATGRSPRGARFAGAAEAPEPPRQRPEPLDAEAGRETAETVATLVRLRRQGRSGEAHALLVEIAYWPAARFPLLAAEMQRTGLGADWATLLWEAASLPADRLVAAADALVAAGRGTDGEQILRQGVARPAAEIGRAVLTLAAEDRLREIRALLDAYVRVRTPEEAARSAEPGPRTLVPLLLEAARGVSEERHWDLVHALRVAGFTA